jgi:hypothetical protein
VYPLTGLARTALRHSHTKLSTATHRNLVTGVTTTLPIDNDGGGTVTEDIASQTRRTLTLTIPNTQALWDVLDTPGGEITIWQALQFVDGHREWVPMGVFVVDQNSIGYSPSGQIALTCPDRSLHVQRNGFGVSRASVPGNANWQEIKRLVEGAWPGTRYPFPGWASIDTTATGKVGSRYWDDGSRVGAIDELAATNALDWFFDRTGKAVLRRIPQLTTTSVPVWTIDASQTGVLIDANRTRDMSPVRNALRITSSSPDITFLPVEVANTTAGDPLAIDGPLGYVPEDWSSPNFRNSAQARTAGLARLRRTLGVAKKLELEAIGNPALDAEDVLSVLLPQIDRNTPRPSELHISDSISHPLLPTGTQTIATRSTRPDTDGT